MSATSSNSIRHQRRSCAIDAAGYAPGGLRFDCRYDLVFLVTSAFLFIMGLRLIGGAIQELQEQLLVPYDVASVPEWIIALGVNPTWEAIGAQLIIAAAAIASMFAVHLCRSNVMEKTDRVA
jgi:divalent metal cation (Fe/Co/Zn/Cd) transporter